MKKILNNISHIGVLDSDDDNTILKKVALTLLPFLVFFPAALWSLIYIYLDNIQASIVPLFYIIVSLTSSFILYKTKKFIYFEIIQLLLILILPFVLMWILGGFSQGSFVMIWAFYAPVVAVMYSENIKVGIIWFSLFMGLLVITMVLDGTQVSFNDKELPLFAINFFIFLNVGAGLGGIYFLINNFIKNLRIVSQDLKRDRESLFKLTHDLKNANVELEKLANCDLITDLPNRLYFQDIVYDMFHQAKNNNKIVAIMFLDLDGFKSINDTLGHEAGDMILKVVGSRLKSVVRDSDTVARIGGDEFAIAIGNISDVEHVKRIASALIKQVNETCPYKDTHCHVGVSIGISFYPEHGEGIDELMQLADKAMYDIKKMGKNNYSIYKEI